MDKQEIIALKKDIQKLKTTDKKLNEAADKCRDKITSLQSELEEKEKEIAATRKELSEKEAQLKKADYSSALQKLDDAVLSKFTKRQAELLTERILSGEFNSLLEEKDVVTSSNDDTSNNEFDNGVATNSNE